MTYLQKGKSDHSKSVWPSQEARGPADFDSEAFLCLKVTGLDFILIFFDWDLMENAFPSLRATGLDLRLVFFALDLMETAFPCLRATYLEFMLVFCDLDLIGTAFPCLRATDLANPVPAAEDFMAIFLGVFMDLAETFTDLLLLF